MKKRLLSLLLLAVMLVSVIPFTIFASAAEDATEEEPYNYNGLYVEDSLILAFDIMASNGFGGQALADFPQSPITMTDYLYGGKSYDFTDPAERYDYSGRYFVMYDSGTEAKPNKRADYTAGVHLTKEAAESAMATRKAADTKGYTWTVEGPYNYLILRMTKTADGEGYLHTTPIVMLQEVSNSTGYTTERDAMNAVSALEQKDTADTYEYFVMGSDTNAAFQAAGKAYTAEVNAWISTYTWAKSGKTTLATHADPSNHSNAFRRLRDSRIVYAPIVDPVDGQGYITQKYPYSGDWGIQINNIPDVDSLSAQIVSRMGEKASGNFLILADVRPERTLGNGMLTFTKAAQKFKETAGTVVTNPVAVNTVNSLTYTLTGALNTDTSVADTFSIVTPDTVLYSAEGVYTPNGAKLQSTNILGYSNSAAKAEHYAIRYYSKALTAAEINQNHFADIAKWYQLDMNLYEALSNTQKADARAALLAFVAADASLNFSAATAARSTVQNFLDQFALDTIYNQLTDAPEAFKTIAKGVRADISSILALPLEIEGVKVRDSIYNAVIALPVGSQGDAAIVQATIATEFDRILQLYYGAYMNTTTMTYKDIYVHKDNLVIWLDFFAAKATDGNLYADYSYTDQLSPWDPEKYGNYTFSLPILELDENGNVQYEADGVTPKYKQVFNADGSLKTQARRAVKGDMVPNWHLPSTIKVNGQNTANPDKIKIPQTSNMEETMAKYVFKNDTTSTMTGFKFYDLPDTGYGHTNIRTFGDGCLIGGLNNSLKVYSPGKDSDVTYQFVTNMKGNLQLDGYRANFSLTNGVFKISNLNYYSYGVDTSGYTLSESALQTYYPNKSVNVGNMMDLTITIDKTIGQDTGHYYTEVYDTNAEGAVRYTDTVGVNTRNLYLYVADGTRYLCEVNGTEYTAYYTVNAVGNKFFIAKDDQPVNSVKLVKGEDGSFTVNWDSAVYGVLAEGAVAGAQATAVLGPYYDKTAPFPEVSSETPGATGPIVYRGTYDLGVYANGDEYAYLSSVPYQASDIGSVGNSGDLTTYAIRTYNIILTENEIRQNHFADLAGFYGLDLAPYALLNATQRTELHKLLAGLQLGLSKAEGKKAYQDAIDAVFYNFDTEIAGATHFLSLCHAFGLDTSMLAQLSPEAQARVFAEFESVDAGAKNEPAILQKNLVDAVNAEIKDRYAAAFGHNTIAFDGWQLHQVGDYGMRALFSTDLNAVADLEGHGATVRTGLLMVEKGSIKSIDALKVSIGEDGTITAPEGVTLVEGYWNGVINENAEYVGDSIRFTEEILLGLEDAEEDKIIAALEDRQFYYVGFSVVEYAETVDGETYDRCTVFYENATLGGKADAYSVYDVSAVAKYDYKIATKNVQTVTNLIDEEMYISASVGSTALEDYLLVRSAAEEDLNALQGAVKAALGFELDMARAADVVAGASGYIYIGAYDNLHATKCYGISTFGGNVYIWANVDAEIADAVALFTDYLELQLANGADAIFEDGVEIVCRAR